MSFTRGIFWMMSALISVLPQRMPIKCMSYGLWKSLVLDRLSPMLTDCLTAYRGDGRASYTWVGEILLPSVP